MATQYVRLANRLSDRIVADLDSGWSIAGLDVRKAPDKETDPRAAKFVKKALADGRLEPASKAEWDEVHDNEGVEREALDQRPRAGVVNSQEAHIQREAEKKRKAIAEGRNGDGSGKKKKSKKAKAAARKRAQADEADTGTDDGDDNDGDDDEDEDNDEGSTSNE